MNKDFEARRAKGPHKKESKVYKPNKKKIGQAKRKKIEKIKRPK
jgi:hypothetical protein